MKKKHPIPKRKAEDYTTLYTTDAQSENGFFTAAVCMKRETPYFFYIFRKIISNFFFENQVMALKLVHGKGFWSHPFYFLRHC